MFTIVFKTVTGERSIRSFLLPHEGVGEMSNHNFLLSSNLYMYTSEIKLGKRALKIILAKYVNYFSQNRQAPVFIIYSQLQNSVIDVLS